MQNYFTQQIFTNKALKPQENAHRLFTLQAFWDDSSSSLEVYG